MGILDRLLERTESRLSIAEWVWRGTLFIMSAGIPAWAAHLSTWLNYYGPIAWVGCGFLGILTGMSSFLAFSIARQKFVAVNIRKKFLEQTSRVNPLETTFQKERIILSEFISVFDRKIKGKTFIDCEIIGPVNASLTSTRPGSGSMQSCTFWQAVGVVTKENVFVPFGVLFEDCQLIRCQLYGFTLFVPGDGYWYVQKHVPGLVWLTQPPPKGLLTNLLDGSSPNPAPPIPPGTESPQAGGPRD